jgi:DNA-binding transcriptional MerR regulator
LTKAPQAFRTISEVSETLDVPQHVLRFWEGKFPQIKPMKRAGGRRYYRPADIELLRGVRTLLYAEGYTIKGVQKVLRDSGAGYVAEIGRFGVKRNARAGGWDEVPAYLAAPPFADSARIEHEDAETLSDAGHTDEAEEDGDLAARRATLKAALQELLSLRDLLRSARAKKADAA